MKSLSGLAVVTFVLFAGCAAEDETHTLVSSKPTEAQLLRALSDPLFISASDSLLTEGLQADIQASDVIMNDEGDWALLVPVSPLWSIDEPAYEEVVYQVLGDVSDVSLVPTSGLSASELSADHPEIGSATYNLGTCSAWGSWRTVSSYCTRHISCFLGQATMWHRQRSRTCRFNGSSWQEYDNKTVRHACGC